jgi:FkbM family methyltransferase
MNRIIRNILRVFNNFGLISFVIPPSGKFKVKLKNKEEVTFVTNQTSFLTSIIYWKGLYEFEYSKIFIDLIESMSLFVDVGANIGFYSVLASKLSKNIQVYAFEPASGPFKFLEKNININNLQSSITPFMVALSGKNGAIDFYEYKNPKYSYLKYNLGGVSSELNLKETANLNKTRVKSITIDDFIKEESIYEIDLIKLDTEGTEDKILKAGNILLKKIRPIIICETLFNNIEIELDGLMRKNDYLFYNSLGNKLQKVETIIRKTDNGIRDCFFVPIEKEHLVTKYL